MLYQTFLFSHSTYAIISPELPGFAYVMVHSTLI